MSTPPDAVPDDFETLKSAFLAERAGALGDRFGCATPREALASHRLFDAALRSAASQRAEPVEAGR